MREHPVNGRLARDTDDRAFTGHDPYHSGAAARWEGPSGAQPPFDCRKVGSSVCMFLEA
jgi:hypothetical protein